MSMFAVFFLTLLADIDFSAAEPGAIRNRLDRDANPGFVRTEDIYSRRLGDALDVDPRFEHPRYALGRDGKVSAVKTGNARKEIPGSSPAAITLPESCVLPTEGPSTQLFWFYVYDVQDESAYMRLVDSSFGYQVGFRLEWIRAHWMPSGGIAFVYGDGKTSKSIKSHSKKDCLAGVWHQAAIVNDGKEFEFFLNGDSLGRSPGNYLKGALPLRIRLGADSDEVSFKTDSYKLYARALTAKEIADDWKKGKCSVNCGDELKALKKLPEIKGDNHGIFAVGEKIEIVEEGKTVENFSYDKPGVYEKICKGRVFPICVVPARPVKTDIGAVDLLGRQPELMSLGIRKTLVKIPWRVIEPEKNAYDWESLDVIGDTCGRLDVETVFVLTDEPDWFKKDPKANAKSREKFCAYAQARYEMKLTDESEIGYVNAESAETLARDVTRLRSEGKKHIFINTRPPEWRGRYAAAFEGRPGSAVLAIGEYLSK